MLEGIRIVLCDLRDDVVSAWRQQFERHPEVEVRQGDILEARTEALLLPGNGFGFLDRGLELAVCERFGFEVQDALREAARGAFRGELLVGQACLTPLGEPFRSLVYACIYRTPQSIAGTINAFLAARGAFLALAGSGAAGVGSLAIPGMGTGAAGLHPLMSARQLRYAYEMARGIRGLGDKNLTRLSRRERKLGSLPASSAEGSDE